MLKTPTIIRYRPPTKVGGHSLKVDLVNLEARFENAAGKYSAAEDVLLGGRVVRLLYDVHPVQEILCAVYELVFVTSLER